MSAADKLLGCLTGVKRTGQGRWVARCPAHEDRGPSLSIREMDDGRTLLHCFAGCSAGEVIGAVGLEWADLFPERPATAGEGHQPVRRPFNAAHLIEIAAAEAGVAAIVALDVLKHKPDADVDRLLEAANRLADIAETVHHG